MDARQKRLVGCVRLTNGVPPDRAARRVLVIIGMIGFFVCPLAIQGTFDGVVWSLAWGS